MSLLSSLPSVFLYSVVQLSGLVCSPDGQVARGHSVVLAVRAEGIGGSPGGQLDRIAFRGPKLHGVAGQLALFLVEFPGAGEGVLRRCRAGGGQCRQTAR